MFGNKKLSEVKAAFEGAHIGRKDSLLYDQCKEIVEDARFKAAAGHDKGHCFFRFDHGTCSAFAIGNTSRPAAIQPCIVITGTMQVGHQHIDIKLNCTERFPTDAPQVFFSPSNSNSFHAFPFALLPPPAGSQNWNFCAGTKLIQLLLAMQQYTGALPYNNPPVLPVPPPTQPGPLVQPTLSTFEYRQPVVAPPPIASTFVDQSPMQEWMRNPNGQRQAPVGQAAPVPPGWPHYSTSPPAPPHHQNYDSDIVPTPPLCGSPSKSPSEQPDL